MSQSHPPRPLLSRPVDMAYVAWFALHLAVMFAVDLVPLYPAALQTKALLGLRAYYIDTYHDRNFTDPPAWFVAYAWMELLYHVPVSVWALGALARDDPLVPVHLLVWAVQTVITTATCIVDFLSWEDFSREETMGLVGLYCPYSILALIMGLDMFFRLQARLAPTQKAKEL